MNIAIERKGHQLYLVDDDGKISLDLSGRVGTPFFSELVLPDCLHRTENAMMQWRWHASQAIELCLCAQTAADAAQE